MKTKTKTILRAIVLFVAVTFTISCSDDFFDKQAGNRIDPEKHYQSMVDVQMSLYGAIVPLQNVLPNLIMIDGLRSDLMDVTPNASIHLQEINQHIFSADNPYLDGSDFYKSIINLNEVLINLPKVYENDPNFDDFYLKYITGGVIGMRSWIYFTLARLYGEVVWVDGNLTSLPDGLGQKTLQKDALIDTLINQLEPYIHTDELLGELRISYYVNNKALLGELYLEKNDYANAAHYLKLACESYASTGIYKVDRTFSRDSWFNIFISAGSNETEVISAMPYDLTEGQANPLRLWMQDAWVVKPTQYMVDTYRSQEGMRGYPGDENRGIGITIDTLSGTDMYIKKYSLDMGEERYSSDIIISRAAGVHLLLAEALNRMGQHNLALILLNNGINGEKDKPAEYVNWAQNRGIRGRAYVTERTLPEGLTDDKEITEVIEGFIITERVLEQAYEGHRWFDLMRIAKRRNWNGYLADKVASKFSDASKANEIREKLKNEQNWYLPVVK